MREEEEMNKTETFTDEYIFGWLQSLTTLHLAHWDAARFYEKVNLSLGIATTLTAAISGVSAFTQLEQQVGQQGTRLWVQIAVGIFGITAAALAALQAFFRSSELSARHKRAAQKFGQLRREFEQDLNLGLPTDYEKRKVLLTEFRSRWDSADDESPPVPQRIYDKNKAEVKKRKKYSLGSPFPV
jgi:hypothetical protein